MNGVVAVIGGLLILVGVILIVVGKRKGVLKSAISDTPTQSVSQLMQADHAEMKGVVSCDQPLTALYSDIPCVYYSYKLKERQASRSSSGGRSSSA
jgi:hypothetical protein